MLEKDELHGRLELEESSNSRGNVKVTEIKASNYKNNNSKYDKKASPSPPLPPPSLARAKLD